MVLLRKLLDSCPFPQAKSLLVDISRALFLEMVSRTNSIAQTNLIEFKRAPHQPKSSQQDSLVPTLPNSAETVDTKMAIKHLKDMQNLERYHFKLDEYALQYPLEDLPISTISSIFLDLFVLPALRLISSEYDTAFEVGARYRLLPLIHLQ